MLYYYKGNTKINKRFILYYGFMPVIAIVLFLLKNPEDNYSYILLFNTVVALLVLSYFLYSRKIILENFQIYFLIYVLLSIFLDLARGQFWTVSKFQIGSACLIISISIFRLTPGLKKTIIKLFIFYITTSFITVVAQRILGIWWGTSPEIIRFTPDEFWRFRFAGYWYSIDQISGITIQTLITAIVVKDLLDKDNRRMAFSILSLTIINAVLSGSRAFMLYMIILLIGFILYKNKNLFKSLRRLLMTISIFILAFVILTRYSISLERIYQDRIYQAYKPFEERSESARINNIETLFKGDFIKWFGNGFGLNERYAQESGRKSTTYLLIGIFNPLYGYGIISIFYYLFWFSLIAKSIKYYRITRDPTFTMLFIGFIAVAFTAGFTYLSNMHGFFILLFFKTYYDEAIARTYSALNKPSAVGKI